MPDGRRVQRSTKETKKKPAQEKADEWEKLAREKTKAQQAHKVIADIYKKALGEDLPSSTVRTFLNGWIARRKGEVKPASFATYSARVKDFLTWLGKDADQAIGHLAPAAFVRYRDNVASRATVTTANQAVKVLRSMFEDARRDGYVADNPIRDVRTLKAASDKVKRQPFTIEQLKAILALADKEWRSMILFGLYTGQRLGDIARLRWSNLDLASGELRLETAKTGRTVLIPLADPLMSHIGTLTVADTEDAFIHPRAAGYLKTSSGQAAVLSRQFAELLAAVGLRAKSNHQKKAATSKKKSHGRELSALSFHSLRHTATSLMKNAGVSPAIVQDIISLGFGVEEPSAQKRQNPARGRVRRCGREGMGLLATAWKQCQRSLDALASRTKSVLGLEPTAIPPSLEGPRSAVRPRGVSSACSDDGLHGTGHRPHSARCRAHSAGVWTLCMTTRGNWASIIYNTKNRCLSNSRPGSAR